MNRQVQFLAALILFLIAGGVSAAPPTAPVRLTVIPPPREVITGSGSGYDVTGAKVIVVSDDPADRFAARLLQQAVRETHGVDCAIVPVAQESHSLRLAGRSEPPPATSASVAGADEAYALSVDESGALIAAESQAGLFYGTQTLIQLLEQSQREKVPVQAMVVNDSPTFRWRGRYFDASQYAGTIVNTRVNLEREIQLLARYKLNCLCFDIYNLVPFKSFPQCADVNTLSAGDWEYLVEFAHRHHVTLIPSLQSLAQVYPLIWTCEEGKPYREERLRASSARAGRRM